MQRRQVLAGGVGLARLAAAMALWPVPGPSLPPLPPPADPLATYHLGHSLVGRDMPAMLAQMAGHDHASQLGWGASLRNVVASANIIRNATTGIGVSVVEGVGRTVVTANLISAAPSGGIRGMRYADFVTEDLTAADPATFPGLVLEKNQMG